ncbi:hypothetical protein Prudu_001983, partial [Prunus dulcis]
FLSLSLSSPPSLSLSSLSPSRRTRAVRRFDFQATARPPQAEPISGKGTVGSASLSPSKPDRPPPLGHPELIGKPCFPTEVRPSPPDFPARISPSFLHQIDRAVEVRGIHHRAIHSFRASKFVRVHPIFQLNFSFVSPPNRSSKAPEVRSTRSRDLRRVKLARTIRVEVRGIHHRAIHSFRASKSGGNFWDWSKYRGDSAEISAEV